jgi:hypothetical protein
MDPRSRKTRLIASGALLLTGVLLLLLRVNCQPAAAAAKPAHPVKIEYPVQPDEPMTNRVVPSQHDDLAPKPGPEAGPRLEQNTQGGMEALETAPSTFDRVAGKHDANDLRLLRAIERITGKLPEKRVYELLEMADRGENVANLRAFIDRHFSYSFRAKHAAMRWLEGRREPGDVPAVPSAGMGSGGGTRRTDTFKHVEK